MMSKFKSLSLFLSRFLPLPLLLAILGTPILAILLSLGWLQQSNVNLFDEEIGNLENKIQELRVTVELKDQLELQIAILKQQIDDSSDSIASKQKLIEQINVLLMQVKALPDSITSEDQLSRERYWLTLEKDRLFLEKDRVNAQNAIYRSLIQILGGLFFVVTAYFSWRNIKAAEDKQITERFSRAVEQLGSDKIEVRLGGIYSLERIAMDSTKDHWTIMEILTSFVQEQSPLLIADQKKKETLAERYLNKE